MINHPSQLVWNIGDLPPVEDCIGGLILVWTVTDNTTVYPNELLPDGLLYRISTIHPYENDLNPLRWVTSSGTPIGYQEKIKFWAWIKQPSQDNPIVIVKVQNVE